MDDPNFSFPGVNVDIPLNTLNGGNVITGNFQADGNNVDMNFEQRNFSLDNENLCENFYADINFHQVTKEGCTSSFVHNELAQGITSTSNNGVNSGSPQLAMYDNIGLSGNHSSVFQNAGGQVEEAQHVSAYLPEFSGEVCPDSVTPSYPGASLPEQFDGGLPPAQEVADHFQSNAFPESQFTQRVGNGFSDTTTSLNEGLVSDSTEQDANFTVPHSYESSSAGVQKVNDLEYIDNNIGTTYCENAADTRFSQYPASEDVQSSLPFGETSAFPNSNEISSFTGEACLQENNRQDNGGFGCVSSNIEPELSPFQKGEENIAPDETPNDDFHSEQDLGENSEIVSSSQLQGSAPQQNSTCEAESSLPPLELKSSNIQTLSQNTEVTSDGTPQYSEKETSENMDFVAEDNEPCLSDLTPSKDMDSAVTSPSKGDRVPLAHLNEPSDLPEHLDGSSHLSGSTEEVCNEETENCISSTETVNEEELLKDPTQRDEGDEDGSVGEIVSASADASSSNAKPLSPMITMMLDGSFGEDDKLVKSEKDPDASADAASKCNEGDIGDTNVRLTRTRTGALRNKTQRLVEEIGASDNLSQDAMDYAPHDDGWEYEEGKELAPSPRDPFITVPDNVLEVTPKELAYYQKAFPNGVDKVLQKRLHCTACGKHVGAAPNYIHLGNRHKVLRVLICNSCKSFYGVGKFPRDSDGSELYCRWCGQGGQVICCSHCPNVFCENCIRRNFGPTQLKYIAGLEEWACYLCDYGDLWHLRAVCWALLVHTMRQKKEALTSNDSNKLLGLEEDKCTCCPQAKKRKFPSKAQPPQTNVKVSTNTLSSEERLVQENFGFGHFLFPNETYDSSMENKESMGELKQEEDDFIDPSLFVQPVLEEPKPPPTRASPAIATGRIPSITLSAQRLPAPRLPGPRLPGPRLSAPTGRMVSFPNRPQGRRVSTPNQASLRGGPPGPPRLVIRQGNLMQPGLVPINNQPNSIAATSRSMVIRNDNLQRAQVASRGPARSPASILNNIDGVRSMDQLQSLEQAPWFRDGIDSVRAVGFAMTKRIRELEARFHSLKNKSDVEKVMILGKKVERLSRKTQQRFRQINLNLKAASKKWLREKVSGVKASNIEDPFNLYAEGLSDWDDDAELSRPLEKVMIPVVSSAALPSAGNAGKIGPSPTVLSTAPPPLVKRSVLNPCSLQAGRNPVPLPSVARPSLAKQTVALPSRLGQVTIEKVPASSNSAFRTVRLPGPKSSISRYVQRPFIPNSSNSLLLRNPASLTEKVGAFLNERNGGNSVSISLSSSTIKRKRLDSEDSNGVVMVYPTISELKEIHKIRPCFVRLEKCDDFIVEFLEKQQLNRCESVGSDYSSEEEENIPEVETVLTPSQNSVSLNYDHNGSNAVDDDDDDIEIIEEVNSVQNI